MFRRLFPTILLLHYFQALGYCSGTPQGVYSKSSSSSNLDVFEAVAPSSNNNNNNKNDGNQSVSLHNNQPRLAPPKQQDVTGTLTDNRRQRRHIGSIAAFRGLPGPFNKFNSVEWPLSPGWDRKPFSGTDKNMAGTSFVDYMENSYDDVNKDKRYPDVAPVLKTNQPPNPVLMRNNPGSKNFEIVTPPHNEARARAVNRLLRLLSEAKANSGRVNSISKKFLGALARNNALPPTTSSKAVAPLVQYKGSTAIPLPGKRSSISSGAAPLFPVDLQRTPDDIVGHLEYASQPEDDSLDIVDDSFVDDEMEYDEQMIKRNIASLAAKGGWMRPSRTQNRIAKF